MWVTVIQLITKSSNTKDSEGFDVLVEQTSARIPASREDVTRSEAELAKQSGYNAEVIFKIKAALYNGERFLIDCSNRQRYEIVRTYCGNRKDDIELTCERRENGTL